MKRYRIGEIARIVGMPQHVIRFYETYGIVKPEYQNDNNYRQFDSLDTYKLLNSRQYRSLGFSLTEAAKMVGKCSHEQLLEKFEWRTAEINQEISKLECQLNRIKEIQNCCYNIDKDLKGYRIIKRPGLYWVGEGNKEDFVLEKKSEMILKSWMKKMPAIYFLGVISKESMLKEEEFNYSWGVAINEQDADHLEVEKTSYIKYISSCDAIYAVIEKEEDKKSLELKHFDRLLRFIKDRDLKVKGLILVELIEIINEGERLIHRFSVTVPV